jgi:hypothetical protein
MSHTSLHGLRVAGRRRPAATLLACVLVMCAPGEANAQKVTSAQDLGARVGGTKTTYMDLVRQVFPDAELNAGGAAARKSVALRHLFGDYPLRTHEGEMSVYSMQSLSVRSTGRGLLVLLIGVTGQGESSGMFDWGEMSVLALFDLSRGRARLLDAADVQRDRFATLREERPLVRLSPRQDAFWLVNHHHNSSENFQQLALVSVDGDRLRTFYDLPPLGDSRVCGMARTERLRDTTLPGAGGNFRKILLTIDSRGTVVREDCGDRVRRRGYRRVRRYVLAWDARRRRYVAQ